MGGPDNTTGPDGTNGPARTNDSGGTTGSGENPGPRSAGGSGGPGDNSGAPGGAPGGAAAPDRTGGPGDANRPDDGTEALLRYLATRRDHGDKVGFTLHDGREFLGWVAELHPDPAPDPDEEPDEEPDPDRPERPESLTGPCALLSWAPGPIYAQASADGSWNPDDEWIPLSAVVPGSPSHYGRDLRAWIPYPG
ncbi:hypothetical protein ACWDR0_03185 [Streptomyces sp. NPDC003691]